MTTPADLLARTLARDGSRPLLTWYDDANGERVELSVATTANWVAKTANLLVDTYDVQPGDLVAVPPTLHWQTAVVLLAAWTAGGVVSFTDDDAPTLAVTGSEFTREVIAQPDDFVGGPASGEDLVSAMPVDLPTAARLLTTLPYSDAAGLGYGLLAALAVDGSVVMAGNPDRSAWPKRCADERVTHTVGIDIPGLPRLA